MSLPLDGEVSPHISFLPHALTCTSKDNLCNLVFVFFLLLFAMTSYLFFVLLILKLTQNKEFPVTVWLDWGQGHRLSAKMVSIWIESEMASWDGPSQCRGINGLPSWMVSSGSGRRVIWLWRCRACACVLSGPHSSIISYDIKYPAQWSNSHSKSPRHYTLCEHAFSRWVGAIRVTHLCCFGDVWLIWSYQNVSVLLYQSGDNVSSVTFIPLFCLWKIKIKTSHAVWQTVYVVLGMWCQAGTTKVILLVDVITGSLF